MRRSLVVPALVVGAALWSGCGGQDDTTTTAESRWVGAERIDVPSTSPASFPQVAVDGAGRLLAVWAQIPRIVTNTFVPGRGWGQPQTINGTFTGAANEPVLALNASGASLVAWAGTDNTPGPLIRVWVSLGSPAGGFSAPLIVNGGAILSSSDALAVALDAGGNGMVLWASDGIMAARYRAGLGWQPAERLSRGPGAPAAAVDAAGRVVVAWSEGQAAVAVRYDPSRGWSAPTRFPADGEGDFATPSLALDPSGRGVMAWERRSTTFGPAVVSAALFDGERWGPAAVISDRAVKSYAPAVALAAGGGVVTWTQGGFPGGADGVVADRLSAAGFEGPRMAFAHEAPATVNVSTNARGETIMAWAQLERSSPTQTPLYRIMGSRYADGAWNFTKPLQAGPGNAQFPRVVVDASGNATVLWPEDAGDGATGIWANRFELGSR